MNQYDLINKDRISMDFDSSNEFVIGMKWIDGRPIYGRVVAYGMTITGSRDIDISSINYNEILFAISKERSSLNNYIFFNNMFDSATYKFNCLFDPDSKKLLVWADGITWYDVLIVLFYTK